MDDPVCIDFQTAEYLAVLSGQVQWGNEKRRASACARLGEAMGKRKMETSLDCFGGVVVDNQALINKAVSAERNMILKLLRSNPGTESLIAAIEKGEHRKKDKDV